VAAFLGVHNNCLVAKEIGHASGEPIRIIHVHLDVVYELIGLLDADLDLLVDLGIDERGADLEEEPIQPWRGAELMVLYYSEGEGKEIRLRKFVSAAAHCTV
jgi:hypothetical protein